MIYTEDEYNLVLQSTAAELQALHVIIESKDGEISALLALKTDMAQKVSTTLQSGDPAQFQALAMEFLTPEQDRIRAEKLAQFEALKTELRL
jgi:precorrin-6B methylase 1